MARLETELLRTWRKINRMMDKGSDASRIKRFYSLLRHFEKLNDRHISAYGCAYNPMTDTRRNYTEVHAHD